MQKSQACCVRLATSSSTQPHAAPRSRSVRERFPGRRASSSGAGGADSSLLLPFTHLFPPKQNDFTWFHLDWGGGIEKATLGTNLCCCSRFPAHIRHEGSMGNVNVVELCCNVSRGGYKGSLLQRSTLSTLCRSFLTVENLFNGRRRWRRYRPDINKEIKQYSTVWSTFDFKALFKGMLLVVFLVVFFKCIYLFFKDQDFIPPQIPKRFKLRAWFWFLKYSSSSFDLLE